MPISIPFFTSPRAFSFFSILQTHHFLLEAKGFPLNDPTIDCPVRPISMPHPTIKDFFESDESSQRRNTLLTFGTPIGDGFTPEEMEASVSLTPEQWQPSQDYDDVSIGDLSPGPRRVTFVARIVNFYNQPIVSKKPQAAKGCLNMLVKDDTAAITVCFVVALISCTPH